MRKDDNLENILVQIKKIAIAEIPCDYCYIWIHDTDSDSFIEKPESIIIDTRQITNRGHRDFIKYLFKINRPIKLESPLDHRMWMDAECSCHQHYNQKCDQHNPILAVPILVLDKIIGILECRNYDKRTFKSSAMTKAINIAKKIANAYLSFRRLQTFSSYCHELLLCTSLEKLYRLSTSKIRKWINCRTASIFLFNDEGNIERQFISGITMTEEFYKKGESLTGKSVLPGNTKYGSRIIENNFKSFHNNICDIDTKKKISNYIDSFESNLSNQKGISESVTHVMAIPLNGINRSFGVLRVINKLDERQALSEIGFNALDADILSLIANILSVAITNLVKQDKYNVSYEVYKLLDSIDESIYDNLASLITLDNIRTSYKASIIRIHNTRTDYLDIKGTSFKRDNEKLCSIKPGETIVGEAFNSDEGYCLELDLQKNNRGLSWPVNNGFISTICFRLENKYSNLKIGTLSIYTKYSYKFDLSDIAFLRYFAQQISSIINVIDEISKLKFLNEISKRIISIQEEKIIYEYIVASLKKIIKFRNCSIIKKIKDSYHFIATTDISLLKDKVSIDSNIVKHISNIPLNKLFISTNLQDDNLFEDIKVDYPSVTACVIVPIIIDDSDLYGAMILANNRKDTALHLDDVIVSPAEEYFYLTLANQVSTGITKCRSMRRTSLQKEIIKILSYGDDLEESLDKILNIVLKELDAEHGFIAILTKNDNLVIPTVTKGINKDQFPIFELGTEGITGWVFRNKKSYYFPKDQIANQYYTPFDKKLNIKSEIITPIIYDINGDLIGFIAICSDFEESFHVHDKLFLEDIASDISALVINKVFYNATQKLSELKFENLNENRICELITDNAGEVLECPFAWTRLLYKSDQSRDLVIKSLYVNQQWEAHYSKVEYHDKLLNLLNQENLITNNEDSNSLSWKTVRIAENIIDYKSDNFNNIDIIDNYVCEYNIVDLKDNVSSNIKTLIKLGCKSMLSAPMIASGELIGVINLFSRREYTFKYKDKLLLHNLAQNAAFAIKNARLSEANERFNKRYLEIASYTNPGTVAMGFAHDVKHIVHDLNIALDDMEVNLRKDYRDSGGGIAVLNTATESTDLLRVIFKSMVSYGSKSPIVMKHNNLMEIITKVEFMFSIKIRDRKIHVRKSISSELMIYCDQNLLELVFVNLFSNSMYFLYQKKQGARIIHIKAELVEKHIEILFIDNGIGIPNELLVPYATIFDPLVTTKGKEGSGLGLSICKRIIEFDHSGFMGVDMDYDKGQTKFIINLPIVEKKRKLEK